MGLLAAEQFLNHGKPWRKLGSMLGVIAYWNPAKGFGFIYSDEEKRRIFFHISQYKGPKPEADQVVEFDLAPGFRGHLEEQAVNVKLERAGVTALRAGAK